jgi:hypothetical protein
MKLTKTQIKFLDQHNIRMDQVFDATGLSQARYYESMKEGGFIVATGVSRCKKGSHSLKTRSGHCVMCNPANLAFQIRHEITGDLYVLYSSSKRLIKVGVAGDADERVVSANKQAYGGIDDWKLKFSIRVNNAGQAEKIIHDALDEYKKPRYFIKDSQHVLAQEIFSCSAKYAIEAIKIRLE